MRITWTGYCQVSYLTISRKVVSWTKEATFFSYSRLVRIFEHIGDGQRLDGAYLLILRSKAKCTSSVPGHVECVVDAGYVTAPCQLLGNGKTECAAEAQACDFAQPSRGA